MDKVAPESTKQGWRVGSSNEIVSKDQVAWLKWKARHGCTLKCLPCHFSELYLRDLDAEYIEMILEDELTETALPSHGEVLLHRHHNGQSEYRAIPKGIYHKVGALYHGRASVSADRIAFVLRERWGYYAPLAYSAADVRRIGAHWYDGLPQDDVGHIIVPPFPDPAPRPDHHFDSLPTTPVTPRNGENSRTSFPIPPPNYSPRPTWRGIELRHAREVVPEAGQDHGPYYPAGQTPDPPAWQSPPAYSSPLARASVNDDSPPISPMTLDPNSQGEHNDQDVSVNNIHRARAPILLGRARPMPARPTLDRGDATLSDPSVNSNIQTQNILDAIDEQFPAGTPAAATQTTANNDLLDGLLDYVNAQLADSQNGAQQMATPPSPTPSSATLGSFPPMIAPATVASATVVAPATDSETSDDSSSGGVPVSQEQMSRSTSTTGSSTSSLSSYGTAPEQESSDIEAARGANFANLRELTSFIPEAQATDIAIQRDQPANYRASGAIARAVINQYPYKYRDLTDTELQQIDDEITQIRTNLAEPDLPLIPTIFNDIGAVAMSQLCDAHDLSSFAAIPSKLDTFVYIALRLMRQPSERARTVLAGIARGKEHDINSLRMAFYDICYLDATEAYDRQVQEASLSVREDLAAQMGKDIASVLPPFELDDELENGSFSHDIISVAPDFLDDFLHSLPAELAIFTEENDYSRMTPPRPDDTRAAPVDDYILDMGCASIRYLPSRDCTEIIRTICQNIVVQIFRPHLERLERDISMAIEAFGFSRDDNAIQTICRILQICRAARMHSDDQSHGYNAELEGPNQQQSPALAEPTQGDDEPPTPIEAHFDLPAPTEVDTAPVITAGTRLCAMRVQYGEQYRTIMSHFPISTVWTRPMLAALPALVFQDAHIAFRHGHTLNRLLREAGARLYSQQRLCWLQLRAQRNTGQEVSSELVALNEQCQYAMLSTAGFNNTLDHVLDVLGDYFEQLCWSIDDESDAPTIGREHSLPAHYLPALERMLDAAMAWMIQLDIGPDSSDANRENIIRADPATWPDVRRPASEMVQAIYQLERVSDMNPRHWFYCWREIYFSNPNPLSDAGVPSFETRQGYNVGDDYPGFGGYRTDTDWESGSESETDASHPDETSEGWVQDEGGVDEDNW